MAGKIIRVTMFKLPVENSSKMSALYKTLTATAKKDGKPYILSLEAGPLFDDARSQGFTFASKSEFASKEDMAYYDADCEAHAILKAGVKEFGIHGMMMVYYTPAVTASL